MPQFNINNELSDYFKNNRIDIVITSHGTLDIKRLSGPEKQLAQKCKEEVTIIPMTGWDFRHKGRKIAENN